MSMPKLLTPGKLLPFEMDSTSKGWSAIEAGAAHCWKEQQFGRVREMQLRGDTVEQHFSVGLALHAMRAQWLNDGYSGELWRKAGTGFIEAFNDKHPRRPLHPRTKLISMKTFEGYVKHWRLLPKPEVLAVEYELEPRTLTKEAPPWAARTARLDSVERWRGGIYIGECKSTSESANAVMDTYALNGQPLLYMALWSEREAKRFGPLKGILYDVMKKATDTEHARFYPRAVLPMAAVAHALTWFKKDFTTWVMQEHLIDWNASPERRMNCMRPYGPCKFRDICVRGRDGALAYEFKDGTPVLNWKPSPGKEVPPWM